MLRALSKTRWLRFNSIWAKPAKETSPTYMETRPFQQQIIKPYEAYSQVRRSMY